MFPIAVYDLCASMGGDGLFLPAKPLHEDYIKNIGEISENMGVKEFIQFGQHISRIEEKLAKKPSESLR